MGNPRTITDLNAPIRSIMASVTITITPSATLREVTDLLAENDIGAVPVVGAKDKSLVGIVGERDVIRAIAEGLDLDAERVGDVMTLSAESIAPTITIGVASEKMLQGGIRHLPVVTDDEKLAGIVSIRDLLAAHDSVSR